MKDIHVAQIGKGFNNEDSFDFLSDQNMNEYDFIIIESDIFINSITEGFSSEIKKRIEELKEFIALKDIPVVFLCFKGGEFYTRLGDTSLTITQLIGLEANEVPSIGRKIEINPDSLFTDLMKRYHESFEYNLSFSKHPGTSIGKTKGKPNSIGFYTRDFVFLPVLNEFNNVDNEIFLNDLYEVCCLVRRGDDILQVPDWAKTYLLPGENDERERLNNISNEIIKLQEDRNKSELRLANFLPLKQLWTASGTALESAVKNVFLELGFTMLPTEDSRDDIIMKFDGQIVIAEIKGQNKSAAEKNAAQLEKWVSTYISKHEGGNPKGLLIVNTFREQPLEDRVQVSFPNQMLSYSIARGHCLLTTLQLCTLLLFCRDNPSEKDIIIGKLLNTIGCLEDFNNWSDFIKSKKERKKSIKKNV